MKGIVFTEFLDMVEDRFTLEVADRVIAGCDLPSGGIYTAVGTYDHNELVQIVIQLSTVTGIAVPDLLRTFGKHLFGRFVTLYPKFFEGVGSAFAILKNIENHIHVEVRKLYPDAETPSFKYETLEAGRLTLIYRSQRPFADLAEGLILGCTEHFGENIDVQREDLAGEKGTCARFSLTKRE